MSGVLIVFTCALWFSLGMDLALFKQSGMTDTLRTYLATDAGLFIAWLLLILSERKEGK